MAANQIRTAPISNVDAAWYRMEDPTNLMMVTAVFTFETPLDFERVKEILSAGLLRHERFRQRVVESRLGLGSPRWETDPTFDISAHVHRVALPAPADQAALEQMVSDLMSTPLDYSKPLWQYHLIEGYEEGSALLVRLHHCLADGIALVRVLLSMTTTEPDALLPLPAPKPRRKQGWNPLRGITRPAGAALDATRRITETLLDEGLELISNPAHALELTRSGADAALAFGKLVLLPPDPKTVFKGKLGIAKQAVWSRPIPLGDIKTIGRATGGTVNDVLLAAVTGALRRYLQSRGQRVRGLNFRAFIPVNLRDEEEEIKLGNRFGLVFLSLPIGIADPLERLLELKRRMDQIKSTPEAVVAFGILNAIGMAPADIESLIVDIFGVKATAVMTNVPGPTEQLYFAGSPLKQFMFWVPQSGRVGLGVSILSYNDQVWLGVGVDSGLIPDPGVIIAGFHRELDDLCSLARQVEPETTAETGPGQADDLTQIKGVGPKYAARLQAAGISTFSALARLSPADLADLIDASDWRRPDYQAWIDQAQVTVTFRK